MARRVSKSGKFGGSQGHIFGNMTPGLPANMDLGLGRKDTEDEDDEDDEELDDMEDEVGQNRVLQAQK